MAGVEPASILIPHAALQDIEPYTPSGLLLLFLLVMILEGVMDILQLLRALRAGIRTHVGGEMIMDCHFILP